MNCGSLETKRNGRTQTAPTTLAGELGTLQRFLCASCGSSFTSARRAASARARFSDDVMAEAVKLYVQSLSPYRSLALQLARRLPTAPSRTTLWRWVDAAGSIAKTPLQVSAELAPPGWGGFLGVDGKAIFVHGVEHCLLVAVDQRSQDVVHALVVDAENEQNFERLVRECVTVARYPLKGLVIDAAPAFLAAHQNYFARLDLQLCRIHASRRLDYDVPKAKGSPTESVRAELKDRVRAMLFAPDEAQARQRFDALVTERDRFTGLGRIDTVRGLQRRLGHYFTHYDLEGMPADANITENVIKQLGKKLALMEGFASMVSAERFSRLLIGCYRFKRFTGSCRQGANGRSPLELAGVRALPSDWLRYLTEEAS